jgi:hypothetical protein
MTIKVQCGCGTRFSFEVVPVAGRMPVPIHCPTCNADDTELANALIQQQLSTPVRIAPVATSAPPPEPAPAPPSGLRVARLHHAQQAAPAAAPVAAVGTESASAPTQQICPKHKSEIAVETCHVCGKPICLKCMGQFGYVCSVYCRQQADAKGLSIPVYAQQKSVVEGKARAMVKLITVGVSVVVILFLGLWTWYAWFGRNPKIVYSLPIPKFDPNDPKSFSRPDEFYQLIAPGRLLSIKNKQVSVFDIAERRQIWSSPLRSEASSAAATNTPAADDESDYYFPEPRVVATSNDIWVVESGVLARFDAQSGSRKETGIKDKILNLTVSPDSILVVSGVRHTHESLAKISLPDGEMQTEEIQTASKTEAANSTKISDKTDASKSAAAKTKSAATDIKVKQVPLGQLKALAAQSIAPTPANAADTNDDLAAFDEFRQPYIAAGQNVVEFKTKMLEQKTITHATMKPKGKSVLDNANLNASQGLEVAQEFINDTRREETGGVATEDVSRYQVTLHRRLQKDVPDWTGEVTGPPQFFPMKTVDVLVAGQGLYVFDKQNKKLWESKLTFPVSRQFGEDHPPCLETGDALYFADPGILTRFDLATGNVRWRFNSVGISRILADDRGGLYLVSTTASPEQIQYSQQFSVKDKIHPVVMKLDSATSKMLWRQESIGDEIFLSGKFLYTTRISLTPAILRLEEGPDRSYTLRLLDRSNGSEIWNFSRVNHPVIKTEVQNNWILLHVDNEVLVLKFFSL